MARFDRTIPPGGEGKITLEVKTKKYHGNFHKTAEVMTNDPENPKLTIGMKGKIWTPIHLAPEHAYLAGTLGDQIETVVHLRGEKKEALVIKLGSVSIPDKVAVELHEIEKGRRYQLKVKNKLEEVATYRGQVRLTTNYPEKPEVVIQTSCSIKTPLEVRPKSLDFGRQTRGELQQKMENGAAINRWLTVHLNKGNNLKIEKLELDKSLFRVVTKQFDPGRVVALSVEPILAKLKKGANADRLRIHTNQQGPRVLEVPIRIHLDVL